MISAEPSSTCRSGGSSRHLKRASSISTIEAFQESVEHGEISLNDCPGKADAVVIGGGIVGTATAWNLAKRGKRVILYEKGSVAGEQSGRNWGSIRSQRRPPEELPLMLEGIRIWETLETQLEATLDWRQQGHMRFCYDRKLLEWAEEWIPVGRENGLDTRVLTPGECRKLLPHYSAKGLLGALYTSTDGCAEPQKVAPAFAQSARRLSAEIVEQCAVLEILTENGSASGVVTERGETRADVVICAGGAWTGRLLKQLGIRHPSLWIRGSAARTAPVGIDMRKLVTWGRCACRQRPDGSLTLAVAEHGCHDVMLDSLRYGASYMKLAWNNRNLLRFSLGRPFFDDLSGRFANIERADNRSLDPVPDRAALERAAKAYAIEYPSAKPLVLTRTWAGWIDYMPDALPVLGEAPGIPGLFIGAGFSGNGFGMGPVSGKVLADLICNGRSEHDLRALNPSRFN
ncbi:MAG: FAD-dependent oxidoreductase [Gammaproteobacteria bacterium]|nr:FAD-dependent oxidoreductase [Gammaproteobacteria bacterium]MYD76643.1 FAD-dependent oxidoreductase [Gammaproteobacteria bacterium]